MNQQTLEFVRAIFARTVVFGLVGAPGAGKRVICAKLAQRLDDFRLIVFPEDCIDVTIDIVYERLVEASVGAKAVCLSGLPASAEHRKMLLDHSGGRFRAFFLNTDRETAINRILGYERCSEQVRETRLQTLESFERRVLPQISEDQALRPKEFLSCGRQSSTLPMREVHREPAYLFTGSLVTDSLIS